MQVGLVVMMGLIGTLVRPTHSAAAVTPAVLQRFTSVAAAKKPKHSVTAALSLAADPSVQVDRLKHQGISHHVQYSPACAEGQATSAFFHNDALLDEIRSCELGDMRNRLQYLGSGAPTASITMPSHIPPTIATALREAIYIVQRACYLSRNVQAWATNDLSKDDASPVTVADFAAQVLVIDHLQKAFPNDKYIAEESSELVRTHPQTLKRISEVLHMFTPLAWEANSIYDVLDRGASEETRVPGKRGHRVWVLDPIDGTKGFIRNEHYCIALTLLVDGVPELCVLGVPNLSWKQLQNKAERGHIATITTPSENCLNDIQQTGLSPALVPNVDTGCLFYAARSFGAYARRLSDPWDTTVHMSSRVSGVSRPAGAIFSESAEVSHGSHGLTAFVAEKLGIRSKPVRMDGQGKYAVVGSGAADIFFRLPRPGYREKIWDQAPGYLFIREAGGIVTDLNGQDLDFSLGRHLSENVEGIIASNGKFHDQLLAAIREGKRMGKS